MAKIARKTQKIFGSSASNNGQIGSAQTGAKVLSNDLDVLQQLTAFVNGLNDVTISGQKLIPLEELQSLNYISTTQLAYLFQEGIPEFDNTLATEYFQYGIVKKPGSYELYGSKVDNNIGNALPSQADDANWQYLGLLSDLSTLGNKSIHVREEQTSGTSAGSSISGIQTRVLNTVLNNTISGASLSSNQITLPAGTYSINALAPSHASSDNNISHQAFLYNVTDASDIIVGTSENIITNTGQGVTTKSIIQNDEFTLNATKVLEIRHYTSSVESSWGLGRAASSGKNEVYTDVIIKKIG